MPDLTITALQLIEPRGPTAMVRVYIPWAQCGSWQTASRTWNSRCCRYEPMRVACAHFQK